MTDECPPAGDLAALLDATLPPDRAAAVEAHAESCRTCLGELQRLVEAAALPMAPPDPARTLPPQAGSDPGFGPAVPGYEVLGALGRGGMGVVYKARQSALNRTVALKMIRADWPATAEAARRFRQEAELLARLRHPNVVQVHEAGEAGEAGGRLFLAMEFVEGGSLADRLDGRPLPPREAAGVAEELAHAVQHAHEAGVSTATSSSPTSY